MLPLPFAGSGDGMKRIRTPEQIATEIDKLKAEARTAERRRGAALKRIRAKREAAEKAPGASAPEPGSAG